ncbi:LemA protein [Anaerosolibacter carboniphilus]|uniref:LemA protein n=1 Tax=Anaerosolibacter carboniphilus TaxID=1417629 RepID=A0A841KXE0_9FIRM|nr:LemA family protein [Anaerosolibacter carboniphilus]MBB6216918.1 LemA protein [Anaerosolibacter carboniphilus]
MKSSLKIIIGIVVVLALIGISLTGTYNSMVTKNEEVNAQWAMVESKLQRRFDLIPNLVESVKGIMNQEQEVFGKIADARSKMAGAQTTEDRVAASNELEGALGRLLVVMENYPQLRSAENVTRLMDELAGTENRISVERDRYNAVVSDYNKFIQRFPRNMVAGAMGFDKKPYFEATAGAENAPKVQF